MTAWLFRDDAYRTTLEARVTTADARGLVLDCTIFYPHGGGQPGDTGMLVREDGTRVPIIDTLKGETRGEIVHVLPGGFAGPFAGETVELELDWARRYAHMRMHTACHLLSAVLPYPVTGGSIRRDSARLDFDMPAAAADREALTAKVNALVDAGHAVSSEWIDEAELDRREDLVRTLAVAPPRGSGRVRLVRVEGVDLQACGGTHVANTREIGRVVVAKIENKGRQNRRVTIAFAPGSDPVVQSNWNG
ncbi:MAG: alanyl-tRNA editing protein [Betaproteobacteria bacterium]|nr:alanyl-tRNA editing protein [Betaproteobacteria bacterium]MDH5287541.1 alanyl-tRNA editing protein [Betaproteobacteria bacterium]